MRRLFVPLFLALALIGWLKAVAADDVTYDVASTDPAMNAAIARARSEVDAFIKVFVSGAADSYSVKVPITDHGKTEHFWLSDITYADGVFTGTIDNDPELVHNVKLGQKYSVKKTDISDWLYMKNDKMYGNYTVRVLLPQLPPEEAAKLRAILAN